MRTSVKMAALFVAAATMLTATSAMGQARRGGGSAGSTHTTSKSSGQRESVKSSKSISKSSTVQNHKSSGLSGSINSSKSSRRSSGYSGKTTTTRKQAAEPRRTSGYRDTRRTSGYSDIKRARQNTPRKVYEYRERKAPRVRPVERRVVQHSRVVKFYTPGYHCYGRRIEVLPVSYRTVYYWGRPYYCYNDVYYRPYRGTYLVCRPPYGVFFDVAASTLSLAACSIAYYNTVYRYYDVIDSNYNTIQEQNRIIAQNNALIAQQNAVLSSETNQLRSNKSQSLATRMGLVQSFAQQGMNYYYDDGIFFITGTDGKYVTIVPPAGAVVNALPDDYEEYVFEGKTYYRVDDTIYDLTIIDQKPVFEVIGQLPAAMYEKYNQ